MAALVLKTHYPSGRTWQTFRSFWLCVSTQDRHTETHYASSTRATLWVVRHQHSRVNAMIFISGIPSVDYTIGKLNSWKRWRKIVTLLPLQIIFLQRATILNGNREIRYTLQNKRNFIDSRFKTYFKWKCCQWKTFSLLQSYIIISCRLQCMSVIIIFCQ